jgi:two-component system, NtrC family, response regulator AtoC
MQSAEERVLIVDDDAAVAKVLRAGLIEEQIAAECVGSAEEAMRALQRRPFDVVLSDVRMPGASGMTLLSTLHHQWPETPVILLTAHGTVRMAVEAMREGAMDFLTKPFDLDEVVALVRRALMLSARRLKKVPSIPVSTTGPATRSPAMMEAQAVLARVGPSDCTLLLLGESGTGKEVAARSVHRSSPRAARPFVAMHCAALPDSLLESELFGYERGAFTGASARKPGRLELAEGGTVLLDEIGETSAATQVKLLRVLQEKTFERLGGVTTLRADVRFVAATHRDLAMMVREGQFREDLYYRLSVCPVRLPPLRERREDIVPLVEHFTEVHCQGRARVAFGPDALDVLRSHPWPGNVRQLQNFVERMVLLSDSPTIGRDAVVEALGGAACGSPATSGDGTPVDPSLDASLREAERDAVKKALERARGNRTQAARLLGVSRRTLYNKLAEYGLD